MRKFTISILTLLLFFSMNLPIHAHQDNTQKVIEYTLEIPLFSEGNYYTSIIDEDCTMILEVLDPTDNSLPINIDEINTRALGTEEFAPGSYTRTIRYRQVINSVEMIAAWQVRFTIYSDSTYPRITSVTGFTELKNMPKTQNPYIRRAQATSSNYAYADAEASNENWLIDGNVRRAEMEYRLYRDDSGRAIVNVITY